MSFIFYGDQVDSAYFKWGHLKIKVLWSKENFEKCLVTPFERAIQIGNSKET